MDYDILPPVDDWVFKLIFGDERHKSMLINFLKSIMNLPDDEDYELTFLDTHLKPEIEGDKLGILDVKVKATTGEIIDIEIQINPVKTIGRRISFYKSKLIVEQIGEGQHYSVIQKVVCICITDYNLFSGTNDYLNHFRFYNPKNGLCFEDMPEEIFTLELPKVPARNDGTGVWEWMRFLRAKRKEEFEMAAGQNPEIRKAVNTLYEISADEKARAVYEYRLKAQRDAHWLMDSAIEAAVEAAEDKGQQKGVYEGRQEVLDLLKSGIPPDEIMKRFNQ
jgi:predicted transposase/invertase (TIGR01784 family)